MTDSNSEEKETEAMEVKLFFGSSTGNTEKVAKKIAAELGGLIAESKDIKKASVEDFDFVDGYIIGLSTVDGSFKRIGADSGTTLRMWTLKAKSLPSSAWETRKSTASGLLMESALSLTR